MNGPEIPKRPLGKTGMQVSALVVAASTLAQHAIRKKRPNW